MGYYTDFDLKIISDKKFFNVECKHCNATGIVQMSPYEAVTSKYEYLRAENLDDSQKWYEYNENMIEVSEEFPDILFQLNGAGEEPGDIWVKYYKNGRSQEARLNLELDGFDPDKLK